MMERVLDIEDLATTALFEKGEEYKISLLTTGPTLRPETMIGG